ncbi:outer membrane protein OmpK [Ferrimonas pelagia]|uniref:Outer membrane protein OmpK n=1 Tax=Ferrimonas pelagia TaxID=1177826 RepID=A0ABP9EBY5_9GAMM
MAKGYYPLTMALLISFSSSAAMVATEVGIMDWGTKAEENFGKMKSENSFVKFKGYNATDWGDVYGHVKLEDFEDSDMISSEINLVGQIAIGETGFNYYGQVFNKTKPRWSETNTTLGFSWLHDMYGWDIQLALAAHIVNADYKNFDRSFKGGLNGGYQFTQIDRGFSIGGQDFKFTYWQEHFWGRDKNYLAISGDEKDFGFNGLVAIRWFLPANLSASIGYRYANNNLGIAGYHDAFMYSLQYNF